MTAKSIYSYTYKNFQFLFFKDFDWVRRYIPKIRYRKNKMRFSISFTLYFRDYVMGFHYSKKLKYERKTYNNNSR